MNKEGTNDFSKSARKPSCLFDKCNLICKFYLDSVEQNVLFSDSIQERCSKNIAKTDVNSVHYLEGSI